MDEAITMEKLTKIYDGVPAVDELSLTIERGEIFGLLGPNGAGKSTTILMMLGLTEPSGGSIRVSGIDSTKKPLEVKKRVGYLPDDLGFYQHMTGLENLMYTASLNGIPRKEAENRALKLLEKVGLMDAIHKKTGKYSRGMKQRLGLADVLIKDPEVIILDEPTLGIDPEGVRKMLALIKQLNREQNITVLLSSHHLHQVQQICDRVGIFVRGKLLAKGNVADLSSQLFFEDAYVVHAEASGLDKGAIEAIEVLEGINRVERITERKLEIYCQRDMTAEIAGKLVKNGGLIDYISKKNYGLDEIYHRYFEGREDA